MEDEEFEAQEKIREQIDKWDKEALRLCGDLYEQEKADQDANQYLLEIIMQEK